MGKRVCFTVPEKLAAQIRAYKAINQNDKSLDVFITEQLSTFVDKKNRQSGVTIKIENSNKYCPECKGLLILREGKHGQFYGCKNHPQCKYTASKK